MKTQVKVAIVGILTIAVIAILSTKRPSNQIPGDQLPADHRVANLTGKGLPVLIDVGAETCIPCKMMAPILDELKQELAGTVAVHFLNLDEYPALASEYQIRVKPTQIFYDASGQELVRHEGFMGKEDILAKWAEFGVKPALD